MYQVSQRDTLKTLDFLTFLGIFSDFTYTLEYIWVNIIHFIWWKKKPLVLVLFILKFQSSMMFPGWLAIEIINHLIEEFTSEKLVNKARANIVLQVPIHCL